MIRMKADKENDDLILLINDENHCTWSLKNATSEVKVSERVTRTHIDWSVVAQMLNIAYNCGYETGGKQLVAIKQILKE